MLTKRQKEILDFINTFIEKNEYSPSLDEIKKHFKLKSVSTIHEHIETLKNKGYLKKEADVARSIYTQKPEIFLLGRIAAGEPIEPLENLETIEIPKEMIGGLGNYYALEVKGDSMIDEGILDHDIIVVKHQNTANSGDIIVAITEKGATLKIFRNKNGEIFLEPRNKNLGNIYPQELEIRGKFVGLVRQ